MEGTHSTGSLYTPPHHTTAFHNTNLPVHLMSLASVFGTTSMSARTVPASSQSQDSSSMSGHARKPPFPKSDVQIDIKNHFKMKTYTSSSPVSGQVTITTQRDVRFDSIEIDLIGASKTRTEGYSAPSESTHTFLKLVMPIPESTYPVPRVLETGRTLTIPFHFVLPNFLTLSACHHKVDSEHVREQHLCLPPSMGSWARGNWEKDDLAPHMAEVVYSIKARVWREPELRGRPIKVMEAVKSIQVLPAFAESAPLTISEHDPLYRMSRTKTLRKNILSSKLGSLTVSAQQPRALALHPDGRVAASTVAQLDLQFTPLAADAQPPKITSVAAKMVAYTFYSAGPFNSFPNIGEFMKAGLAARRGIYSTSVSLPTANLEDNRPSWFTHRLSRRDSGYGSDTSLDEEQSEQQQQQQQQQRTQRRRSSLANLIRTTRPPSPSTTTTTTSTNSSVVHTTSIHLPLTLPTARKTFVPTFHSCIVSRVYTLHVTLTVDSGVATKISLDLPVQITVVGNAHGAAGMGEDDAGEEEEEEGLPTWADAMEDAAVDDFLRPRMLGVMEEGDGGWGGLPGYERRG
ncbi:hypothetical protein N0V82_006720 [Gnomoniopsis sp. IMI 355080]|nr:hypothetical protein N0V82_006720 [Gnomoniopsis sp. IMI 355080]